MLWLRYRPLVRGTHNVPRTGSVLFVSNHLSAADTILIPSYAPRKVQFLAKASLFSGTFKGWFFREIGAIPVTREAGSAAQAALEAGRDVLAAGNVFAIFPEGSRSPDGRLYRGRSGAAYLALETGATVIPVGLIRAHPSSRTNNRTTRNSISFGAAVDLSDLNQLPAGHARREATERIMSAIQELTAQERVHSYVTGGRGA